METLEAIDIGLLYWFAPRHTPERTAFWRAVTLLGDGPVLFIALLLALSGFLWIGRWRTALILALAALAGHSLTQGGKHVVQRPRPDVSWELAPQPKSPSFPSSHAEGAMAIYVGTALLCARRSRSAAWRRVLVVGAVLLAVAVGISRLYLGVHFLSDVVGGWALGLACALLAVWADRRWGAAPPTPHATDPARGPFIV